ncbi:lysozyme inhibitor LprI family protein [Metabacillus malikii]|uniref:Uncharacterized protein YecT (DUF1311 family) n=1 Tax=Metabacillus malikii TaxID=1504265 RepID=A0ABT9ZCC4_9BACI|nr:lysozyme inhibitor LprI family protein [Metabacillus malikii]MDQ0229898.1 uncharacterized protein YecT (DUF1311 family) [Metabacillus malikii]
MKRNYSILFLCLAVILLASCGNASEESKPTIINEPKQEKEKDSNDTDSKEATSNSDHEQTNTKESDINDEEERKPSTEQDMTTDTQSLKQEYLVKLKKTKHETEEKRNNSEEDITIVLKGIEGEIFDVWDGLLNEIYGVLKNQLSEEEMERLRSEQRKWLDFRDRTAKEASLKYEGGTAEQLEYVVVLNKLTEERCFQLVESYMK